MYTYYILYILFCLVNADCFMNYLHIKYMKYSLITNLHPITNVCYFWVVESYLMIEEKINSRRDNFEVFFNDDSSINLFCNNFTVYS